MIDCHCDALWKMWSKAYEFANDSRLSVNREKWLNSNVQVQCFAIFVPPEVPMEAKFTTGLQMIDLFFDKIIQPYPEIKFITNKQDILSLKNTERGAILTLEGLDLIGSDLYKLRILLRLGVKMVGLSWNNPNLVTDGVMEQRGAGLTEFGKEVIQLLNQYNIWTDLAHISYSGFFEAVQLADFPMVSHANVQAVHPHPRNLDDKQIQVLIEKGGLIGINFVREFLTTKQYVTYDDIYQHIDYLLHKGAEKNIIFGSDFDGSDDLADQLKNIDQYPAFISYLKTLLSDYTLNRITSNNFVENLPF
ncbi:dipeptidase [Gracilibacillus dipsosauri]|uniref:dipeptidase n=1 Tax=Gracilibacillus dipsosauri TaxID=178340 RepID=UPI0024095550